MPKDNEPLKYLCEGYISIGKKTNSFKQQKQYNGKILMFKQKYDNGEIKIECYRYDDSTYLYTEYYDWPNRESMIHLLKEQALTA